MQHTGRDKSFVYDLTIEPGTVRVRVASVPRSTEVQPGFVRFDTFHPPTTQHIHVYMPHIHCTHTNITYKHYIQTLHTNITYKHYIQTLHTNITYIRVLLCLQFESFSLSFSLFLSLSPSFSASLHRSLSLFIYHLLVPSLFSTLLMA